MDRKTKNNINDAAQATIDAGNKVLDNSDREKMQILGMELLRKGIALKQILERVPMN